MWRRRRRTGPDNNPTMVLPAVPGGPPERPRVTALEYFGAKMMADYSGFWVYALCSRLDGHVFYVGQSENLISRLRDWSYQHKDLFDPARIFLIPVENQARADMVELELINFYQPERNSVGRRDELAKRARQLNRPVIGGWNAGQGQHTAPLDHRQATN